MKQLFEFNKVFSSFRMRLMLLVVLALLPAFAMIFYTEHKHSQMADQHMHDDIRQLVHVGISKYSSLLSDTRQMLQILTYLPELTPGLPDSCNRILASLKSGYPYYANIGVIDESGNIICSALPARHNVKTAKNDWFKKALMSNDYIISDYHMGKITGIPVIVSALRNVEKQIVVAASIDLRFLNHWIGTQHLEKTTTVMLLDSHGVVLTRYPRHEDWVGQTKADSLLVKTVLASKGEGSFEGLGIDDVHRVYDFAPLNAGDEHRIYIVAGVELSAINNQIKSIRNRTLIGLLLVVLFVLLIAWYGGEALLLHKLQAVVSAARRLASGDLKSRTGLQHDNNDFGILAKAFDDMASELEKQIDEHSELGNELRRSESKMRNLVGDLQRAREEERKVIAQDIHDEVGGMLAALKMDINLLPKKLKQDEQSIEQMLVKMSIHVDLLIQYVRRMITNLRPSVLDNLGLLEAIEWQLQEFKSSYKINFSIDEELPDNKLTLLDENYSLAIFRIFQEIMLNIAKHARATMVNVFIAIIEDKFVLSVSDNGCGMDEQSRHKTGRLGLISIEERVQSMQGEFLLISSKNVGTTITIQIPVKGMVNK